MKAVVYERYGPPEVLELREIERPVPKDNEVLVKVKATTVTAGDWRMRKADPFLARLFNGLFKPRKVKILGFEIAGVVEETGKNVHVFKKGDPVFASCGFRFGGYAEYTCLPVNDQIAIMPSNMTFEEAAAVPIGGLTALRLLRAAHRGPGEKVLVYGASGSVGTFAIQIAKAFGAHVTAVCSTLNVDLCRELGADEVIDYKSTDFAKTGNQFDIILDAVGKINKSSSRPVLKPGGRYVTVSGAPKAGKNDLLELKALIESGNLRTVIDRRYTLEQIREAHAYVESFRKRGNVVVNVVPPAK